METEGCYNYPETNTSAVCTPRVPLPHLGGGKQMYLIFERGAFWGVEKRSTMREMEYECMCVCGGGEGHRGMRAVSMRWGRTEIEKDARG